MVTACEAKFRIQSTLVSTHTLRNKWFTICSKFGNFFADAASTH